MKSRINIHDYVISKIKIETYVAMESFVVSRNLYIWGLKHPRDPNTLLMDSLLLTIYKDLNGLGYRWLQCSIDFGYKITALYEA